MTELWVYVELCREGIRPVTFELLGKAAELSARCGGRVTAVALGDCDTGALIAAGADRALVGEGLPFPAEDGLQAQALAELCRRRHPDMLLLGATGAGRSLAPRTAALLRTGLTADCTRLDLDENGLLLQTRPAFGGNLMATILCPEHRPQMATVRPGVMQKLPREAGRRAEVEEFNPGFVPNDKYVEIMDVVKAVSNVADIMDAKILVSGGRGVDFRGLLEGAGGDQRRPVSVLRHTGNGNGLLVLGDGNIIPIQFYFPP